MDLNIAGQYKYIVEEQEKIKRMVEKNDQKLMLLKKYLEHSEAVRISREEIKAGKFYTLDKVEEKLGLK